MTESQEMTTCTKCGSENVVQTEEGLYCNVCEKMVRISRAVHHEGFPHVVVDENEQEP